MFTLICTGYSGTTAVAVDITRVEYCAGPQHGPNRASLRLVANGNDTRADIAVPPLSQPAFMALVRLLVKCRTVQQQHVRTMAEDYAYQFSRGVDLDREEEL